MLLQNIAKLLLNICNRFAYGGFLNLTN